MIREASCRVYEQVAVRQGLGETLRPGGLALTERALEVCDLPAGARVLDVGCGAGATVQYLQQWGYRAGGVDLSALLLREGRQKGPDLTFLQADGVCLPLADAQMDAVLAECSLSGLANTDAALVEFYRLLRRGGYLVVSDVYARNPAGLPLLRTLPAAFCLSGAISQTELVAQLTQLGFELVLWEDHSEVLRQVAGPLLPVQFSGLEALDAQLALAKAKPGYFLLIARKE
ncbi:MAG: methyltransferase domain-containing protein [Anaerolineales bacterium]|nr:methyltransferase domain-containing protein [Anaerolineales bacterium]